MGLNAYFAAVTVGTLGLSWEVVLGAAGVRASGAHGSGCGGAFPGCACVCTGGDRGSSLRDSPGDRVRGVRLGAYTLAYRMGRSD